MVITLFGDVILVEWTFEMAIPTNGNPCHIHIKIEYIRPNLKYLTSPLDIRDLSCSHTTLSHVSFPFIGLNKTL